MEEELEFLPRALPSPRLDTQGTLYWYNGDTFTWKISFALQALDTTITLEEITGDTILIIFFNEDKQTICQKQFLVSSAIDVVINGGLISGNYLLNFLDGETENYNIDTKLFSIGEYRYNVIYQHEQYITTIAYQNRMVVE